MSPCFLFSFYSRLCVPSVSTVYVSTQQSTRICLQPVVFYSGPFPSLRRAYLHKIVLKSTTSSRPWCEKFNLAMKQSSEVKKKRFSVFGVFFLIVTYLWAVILFPVFTALFPVTLLLDRVRRRLLDRFAMLWMRLTLFCCRLQVVIQGEENLPRSDEVVMYVANHQSYLDIYVLSALKRKFKFVSKIEVFSYPVIGWAMALAGYVGLKRGDSRRQLQTYHEIVRKLQSGVSLVMFPEGTRSVHGRLLPFKIGPFKAAKQAQVPIVPLTILGTREVMPSFAWLPVGFPNKPITIHVHPMIQVENYEDKQLADICKSVIEKPLESNETTWNRSPL
ncbi:1-acylglycerol-3-phosphate O-acyltransferase isoform 1 [Galdieria sulphuraria]|uniref:1-acyl-sn-glycerol-3-phosphate acyltransferase n=1 Tax=Galdieria sulphuraria TaxID=130081 RepID=M2XX36_GALSU|nr:1-acylglycerol-3-phosphate O-acyltransferase isoform 1 [Galdieria sulphuraria]EME27984.1 1-acylglycerol-3-phosphate O-acyltransferase isoform 1 [Galdieria sulphuraria]|eukprot:XP_005704504.1 1-acylglycerol-3-phosphate O-acyltransferase isoform 1 [Galdieria sulphuraria]